MKNSFSMSEQESPPRDQRGQPDVDKGVIPVIPIISIIGFSSINILWTIYHLLQFGGWPVWVGAPGDTVVVVATAEVVADADEPGTAIQYR